MTPATTALILIGFQNDYFAGDGLLRGVIEESAQANDTLANTLDLLSGLRNTEAAIISTPIIFTPDYSELVEPVGILQTIKEVGAFRADSLGSETIPELREFGDRILEVPGKRGLNAFSNTELGKTLKDRGIKDVVIAGVVTSVCVESTGRHAFESGYKVTILSDCTSGRTPFEQQFYCEKILPLYAKVIAPDEFLRQLQN